MKLSDCTYQARPHGLRVCARELLAQGVTKFKWERVSIDQIWFNLLVWRNHSWTLPKTSMDTSWTVWVQNTFTNIPKSH